MTRASSVQDQTLLQAALEGLEAQKQRLEAQIHQVEELLGHETAKRGPPALKLASQHPRKRNLSQNARKRISDAQRKRWADFRKTHAVQS